MNYRFTGLPADLDSRPILGGDSGMLEAPLDLSQGFCPDLTRGLTRPVIAIDGLPCAGKTTLACRLQQIYGFEILHVDEFLLAEADWLNRRPGFPFPYLRYDEFLAAVTSLAETGACEYYPFDWETLAISAQPRRITTQRPVIVEGISALVPVLTRYYGLKIFVRSERDSVLKVAKARNFGLWAKEWRKLFIPSADMYMMTHPEERADIVVPGRGISSDGDRAFLKHPEFC
jgi:uridine kinase